ncbi:MAG: acyl-CoA dehydrogenase family protein, partial [Alphaproteobacteria bacterium]|nr:acyl-CoA dehydrogenase family protein [Alphaproteobacteria bacterium]
MEFSIPKEIQDKLNELDEFIEQEIKPLENDNRQYFDHRREYARTDWDNDGQPSKEWEAVLREMKNRADAAGHLRFPLPKEIGGQDGSNLAMAMIREHLAHKGLGLHNDLQNESSIVGNFPLVHMMWAFGTPAQKEAFLPALIIGEKRMGF